jgi:predicted nuclease of predicted toxin-antitoxin system
MRIMLDENRGEWSLAALADAGHDVASVPGQELSGAADPRIIEACRAEGCCLVTLDLDFANPFVYRPADYSGIAVLRLPRRASVGDLKRRVASLIRALADRPIGGKLWVVETHRIREYSPADDSFGAVEP